MLGPADLEAWEAEVATECPPDPAASTERGTARDRSRRLFLRMATGTRLSPKEFAEMRGGFFGR